MEETIIPLKFNRKLSFEEILALIDKVNEFNVTAKVEMTIISLSAVERRAQAEPVNDASALPIHSVSVSVCPRCGSNKIEESDENKDWMDCEWCSLRWAK